MTFQIELDPETEARLRAQAERRGIAPEQYALDFLRENLPSRAVGTGRLTIEDFKAMREELTRGSKDLPILPPEATERSSFYEDRW